MARLREICLLLDGQKKEGSSICLDAKFLRGKSIGATITKGRYVKQEDTVILVDGENSGEVFVTPRDGYMGSTFKHLWISSAMYKPYVLSFIKFYQRTLRNSKKGAAIPHLNKELFYNLIIGIPPVGEQIRIAERIEEISNHL